ncbi:adenosylcobinamide-GDP ribazoletransferase [Propionibacterium sp. NM47_B9-13]|jgi:adenosylcobinamide-GDP ribazoletransferase|uniref:Adenosylcobinamide-GDP ribazoletransferase n=2 Tax=Cutibacterium modestum TaxID=2559073 RepID=A0AAD1KNZ2_9ACTN|nr:adenosylcobinamide-GDP ribazoletransferase [Cutibacterium modestum]TGY28800.1 adenosylcobinamide-GDP ribazoletransferase [Propionibacterium sp. NM47_B9-13]AOH46642.1 adenosylcobinamide-GDP ribazoletransferase [Cutibacterium modestum]EFS73218.1 cobalamin-5-phosphate synthase [Cutibacterium modestum HL037PA2]EFS92449.1 cobalamin-5-phosphate synthase [Cutibacterium modestum HL044PA1]EFT14517.1 cobalamin-5-phosphate synthase [Cutibacterium modestum HL037PA3]
MTPHMDLRRLGPLRGVAEALSLFTILPGPYLGNVDRPLARRAITAFPWLGLCLGAVAGGIVALVLVMGAGSWLAGALALCWLAGATGGFHLDGVADTADGLGSRAAPGKALEIMKKSDIGPMGVISIVLVLFVDATAVVSLAGTAGPGAWWRVAILVGLGPTVGRAAILFATMTGVPCARPGGFGSLVAGVTTPRSATINLTAVSCVCVLAGLVAGGWVWCLVALGCTAATLLIARGWIHHLVRRLSGMTGDTFGSINEVTQMTFWVLSALTVAVVS